KAFIEKIDKIAYDKSRTSIIVGNNNPVDQSIFNSKAQINNKNNSNPANVNDPCNDKQFLKLKAKDSLSTEEMKLYIEFSKLCEENKYKAVNEKVYSSPTVKEYPYLPLLIVSIASAGGSYYFFKESSDYSDVAKLLKILKLNPSEADNKASNNMIAGIGCAALSLISTIIAIQPVEVTSSYDSVTLSYKYPIW
ncbi:MAG: hypothetical protein ACM3Q2_16950, partial [Syntrophothermus sp.]